MKNSFIALGLLGFSLACSPLKKSYVKSEALSSTESSSASLAEDSAFKITVKNIGHSHIIEATDLMREEMVTRQLSRQVLNQIKDDLAHVLANMRIPGATLEKFSEDRASRVFNSIRGTLEGHDQISLGTALLNVTDVAVNLGQMNLAARTQNLLSQVSPQAAAFLGSRSGTSVFQGMNFDVKSPFHLQGFKRLNFVSHMSGYEVIIGNSKAQDIVGVPQEPDSGNDYSKFEKSFAGLQQGILNLTEAKKLENQFSTKGEAAYQAGAIVSGIIQGVLNPAKVESIQNANMLRKERERAEKESQVIVTGSEKTNDNDACHGVQCPTPNPMGCEVQDDERYIVLTAKDKNPLGAFEGLTPRTFVIEGYDKKKLVQRSKEEIMAEVRSNMETVGRYEERPRLEVKTNPGDLLKDPIKDGDRPVVVLPKGPQVNGPGIGGGGEYNPPFIGPRIGLTQ